MTGLMAISTKRPSPFSRKEANAADIGFVRFVLSRPDLNRTANKHAVTRMIGLAVVVNPGI